jgi:hypothetical protein
MVQCHISSTREGQSLIVYPTSSFPFIIKRSFTINYYIYVYQHNANICLSIPVHITILIFFWQKDLIEDVIIQEETQNWI